MTTLREAEVELREARRRAAALRRALPPGPEVEDYVFAGEDGEVRLSELFTGPGRSLVVYQLMYGEAEVEPCPMCSMWVDGLNGVARHIARRTDLAVIAQAPIADVLAYGRHRGWSSLRLLSSAGTSFKADLGLRGPSGEQYPGLSVFTRDADGTVRHFYTRDPNVVEGEEGGMDQWCVVWNVFDLTPEGRGDWYPTREYEGSSSSKAGEDPA
jgi:predicted dithiol-disulfide oxidoreductase (DUF899 family)